MIHIGTASQTIKVSIDDPPAQVESRKTQWKTSSPRPSVCECNISWRRSILFRCWRVFSPRRQIREFCWEFLTTCARQTLCYGCAEGTICQMLKHISHTIATYTWSHSLKVTLSVSAHTGRSTSTVINRCRTSTGSVSVWRTGRKSTLFWRRHLILIWIWSGRTTGHKWMTAPESQVSS